MKKTIVHEFEFEASAETIWAFLTEAKLLEEWLMPNDIKAVVGHKFTFSTRARIKLGFDGRVYCEVLEVVPQRRLVYSWRGGLSNEKPLLDSVVTWSITPLANGCRLKLEHSGFSGIKNLLPYFVMNKGWAKIGKRLAKLATR